MPRSGWRSIRLTSGAGTAWDLLHFREQRLGTYWVCRILCRTTPQFGSAPLSEDTNNENDVRVHNLTATRKALTSLAPILTSQETNRLPETLELLFRETLDTLSHRMDAWATSVATSRLNRLRNQDARGVYIGGYGWVEDLTPSTSRKSEGFIHAPSMPGHYGGSAGQCVFIT